MENTNFRKRYFFFDIDGTLAVGNPGRYIPKSAKDAIEKLESQGHFCAIELEEVKLWHSIIAKKLDLKIWSAMVEMA